MAEKISKLKESDITGLKYFDKLQPLLERLHDVGTERDRAGNRKLHMDQYCMLMLLFMFNPVVSSLRALQQASELKNVQRKLKCSRASLGSLSEATDVFDPQRLKQIVGELAEQVKPIRHVADKQLDHLVTAVDGTLINTLVTITEATYLNDRNGRPRAAWRIHTHFDVDRHVPAKMDVTHGCNSGDGDEKAVLRRNLESDHCYLMDRWFAEFKLFNEINSLDSSYVCRLRDNSSYEVLEDRELSAVALEQEILSDQIVRIGQNGAQETRPNHPIRLICIRTTPHVRRGGRKGGTSGPPSDGILRIATNLLDVPAEVIGELYQNRWTIEIFFRFFKHVLGCRHLLSTDPVGIEIQAYCAIIACLLIALWTGRKPTLRTYEMISYYFCGLADEDELTAHIKKLKIQPA
jgi:hypothetical protein